MAERIKEGVMRMNLNDKLASVLKNIWDNNDLDAVSFFREQILNGNPTVYCEKENIGKERLFYHGEPIIHKYSLGPGKIKHNVKQLIPLIKKNDIIAIDVSDVDPINDNSDSPYIAIHILSGLVIAPIGNNTFLYPQVAQMYTNCEIKNGDFVEYITLVDKRHHYGEVIETRHQVVFVKEYEGFHFSYDGCEFVCQDSYSWDQNHIVCVPASNCSLLDKDDYRIEEIRNASLIRRIWKKPDIKSINELRRMFIEKSADTTVYYLTCKNEQKSENPPFLYTVKELAEIKSIKKSKETIRPIPIPKYYSRGNSIIIPNTDEAAKQMRAEVSYHKNIWNVKGTSIKEITSEYHDCDIKFIVKGLYDFTNDPVLVSFVVYSPVSGTISTKYKDMEGSIENHYPIVVDIGNKQVPQINDVIEYRDSDGSHIAKVSLVTFDLVRIAKWNGVTCKEDMECLHGQDDWSSAKFVFIPISACRILPVIDISSEQLMDIIRFNEGNRYIQAPWSRFRTIKKIWFNIDDVLSGLEMIRITKPEMFIGWLNFISSDYFVYVDTDVLKMAESVISWSTSIDIYGDSEVGLFNNTIKEGTIDFVEMIDDMINKINVLFFPETSV